MSKETKENIKYICIANYNSQSILVDFIISSKKDKHSSYKEAIKNVLSKLEIYMVAKYERNVEGFNENSIVSVMDGKLDWCFLAIVAKSYEQRFAYAMLEELRDKNIETLNRTFLNPPPETKPSTNDLQMKLVEFHRKYADPSNISVIYQAQKEVSKVKSIMNDNMNKFVLVNNDLENMNKKAESLVIGADAYRKDAKELQSTTRWGDLKIKLAVGTCALGGTGYGVYYFFFR